MWKILGLLVFCGFLSPSQSQVPGIRTICTISEFTRDFHDILEQDGVLVKHFGAIVLSDIRIGVLLGINLVELKIIAVTIKNYQLITIPAISGVQMILDVRLHISAKLLGLNLITISLDVKTSTTCTFIDFRGGSFHIAIQDCSYVFGDLTIDIVDSLLTVSVQVAIRDHLIEDITPQLCPVIKIILDLLKLTVLDDINVFIALGTHGNLTCQLASLPAIGDHVVVLDVTVVVVSPGKGTLTIPSTAVSILVPPLLHFRFCQALHPDYIAIIVSAYLHKIELELSCTPAEFSGADELKRAILDLIPPESAGGISTRVWHLKLLVLSGPVIRLQDGKVSLLVIVHVEVFIKNADGSRLSIVIVKCSLTLDLGVSVARNIVILYASISSNIVAVVSTSKGITEVSTLVSHCNKLVTEILMPVINARLEVGIPLTVILGIDIVIGAVVSITDGLVVCV